jgi:galactose mutarotase-like enzyme
MSLTANSAYTARAGSSEGFETWTLGTPDGLLDATFAPEAGMIGCSLRHGGEELLHPGGGLAEYVASGTTFGIPLLYPWANRLAGFDYTVRGANVTLDPSSRLLQLDQHGLPIHGLLTASPKWSIEQLCTSERNATLAATLDFATQPELLAAFPFPHELRIEVRLAGAELAIATIVKARDAEVPIAFGYHPYLRIPGVPREHWEIDLPVREHLTLDASMIPTGEREPVRFEPEPLGDRSFDDGYAALVPDHPFALAGAGRRIAVKFGERFPFAQVYSPPHAEFICFEPMAAPTNALRSGEELQFALPGQSFAAVWVIQVEEAA